MVQYVYFFENHVAEVTPQYLVGLVALVREHVENMEHGHERSDGEGRLRRILRYMESKKLPTTSAGANDSSSTITSSTAEADDEGIPA